MRRCYNVKPKYSTSEKILKTFIFLCIRNTSFHPFFFFFSCVQLSLLSVTTLMFLDIFLLCCWRQHLLVFLKTPENPWSSPKNPSSSQFSLLFPLWVFSPLTRIHWRFFCVSGAHDPEWGIYFKTSQASQYCTSDRGDGHAHWVVPCHGTCKGECLVVRLLTVPTILKNSIPT